jgi:hypothetical protein
MPQAVPGPVAAAVGVPPADRQVGGLEDLTAIVGGPPVRSTAITRTAGSTWAIVRAVSSPHRNPL